MAPSPALTDSPQVRSQLVTALELDLIGPTQRVLKALGADANGLETEALDRLPSSWYPSGFLVPTNTEPAASASAPAVGSSTTSAAVSSASCAGSAPKAAARPPRR